MKLSIEAIGAIITCVIAIGAILIYIGRSLQTLNTLNEGLKYVFTKTEKHDNDIASLKEDMTIVKTKQADCEACP